MAKSKSTIRTDKDFLKKPYYEGGLGAMRAFIRQEMKYPKDAIDNKIEGTVHVNYAVNGSGKVIKTKVVSGIGHGCNEEAERIVKLLKFKLNKIHKKKITFNKKIRINFNLPKKRPKTKANTGVSYTVSKTKKKENPSEKKPKQSYGYTINF
mgnify:CR=1 FL=1